MALTPSLNPSAGVSGVSTGATTVTSATLTTTVANTLIVAVVSYANALSTPSSVKSVTGGLSFSLKKSFTQSTGATVVGVDVWYLGSLGTFSDTVQATFTNAPTDAVIQVFGIQNCVGITGLTAFDASSSLPATNAGTTSPLTVTYSTQNPTDLVIATICNGSSSANNSGAPGVPTGFTQILETSEGVTASIQCMTAYLATSTPKSNASATSTIATTINTVFGVVFALVGLVLPQSPFFVPRPGWEEPWYAKPIPVPTSAIQIKQFGVAGQVPAKNWAQQIGEQDDAPQWVGAPIVNKTITDNQVLNPIGLRQVKHSTIDQRHLDDPPQWQGAPLRSFIAYANINFNQYRAPGQVLQKSWNAQVTYQDDLTQWVGQPIASQFNALPMGQKVYGVHGQVPTRNFAPLYTHDDPGPWFPSPISFNSRTIPLLAHQNIFSAPGQPVQLRPNWTYDDPAVWYAAPTPPNTNFYPAIEELRQVRPSFFCPRPGDITEWLGAPVPSAFPPLYATVVVSIYGQKGQGPTQNWSAQIGQQDDGPAWVGAPDSSDTVRLESITPVGILQVQQLAHKPNILDESPQWQGAPVGSYLTYRHTAVTIFGAPGQVPQNRWWPQLSLDESAPWQPPLDTLNAVPGLALTVSAFYGQIGQVVPATFPWLPDDSSNWLAQSVPGNPWFYYSYLTFNPAISARAPFYAPRPDDGSREWQGQSIPSNPQFTLSTVLLFGQPGQVVPFRANLTQDDASYWLGSSTSPNATLLQLQGPKPLNRVLPLQVLDDAFWQGAPQRSWLIPSLTTYRGYAAGGQGPTKLWVSYSDDQSFWLSAPRVNRSLFPPINQVKFYAQPGQAYTFRTNWGGDDPPAWQPTLLTLATPNALTLILPKGLVPPIIYWSPDDEDQTALWSGSGVQPNMNVLALQPRPVALFNVPRGFLEHDAEASWLAKPISNWLMTTMARQVVYSAPGQAPTFRPNFTQDDPPVWFQQTPLRDQILLNTQIKYPPGDTVGPTTLRSSWSPLNYDTGETFFQLQPVGYAHTGIQFSPIVVPAQYYQWPTTYDVAESAWLGRPLSSYETLVKSSQPFIQPARATAGIDDPPGWQGTPRASNAALVGVQGPRPRDVYRWDWGDDAAGWQWRPTYPTMQQILTVKTASIAPLAGRTGVDDPSPWQPPALFNVNLAITQIIGSPFWAPDEEVPEAWSGGGVQSNINLNTNLRQPAQQIGPSILWIPDTPDDAGAWSGSGIQSNQQLLSIPPTPPGKPSNQYPRGVWRIDDCVDPLFPPISNVALFKLTTQTIYGAPGQVPPFRPNFTQDDPAFWVGSPQASAIIIGVTQFFAQKGQAVPFRANFTLDDPQMFQGAPSSAAAIRLLAQQTLFGAPGQVLPFRPNFTIDDPPMWQGQPSANPLAQLYTKTTYPPGAQTALVLLRWPMAAFNYDQDAVQWVGKPFSPDYMLNVPAIPPPTSKFDWLDFFRRGRRRQ